MKEETNLELLKGSLCEGHLFCRQLLRRSFKPVFEKIEWTFEKIMNHVINDRQ